MVAKQISRFLLWLHGWKVDRTHAPEATRCVLVSAPHTTNWDGYFLRLGMFVLDIPLKVAIKDFWAKGPWGPFMRYMGAVGISRDPNAPKSRTSQTDMMIEIFDRYDDIALAIAPEGTRKAKKRWKMGFYYVAKGANVPLALGYLDYKNKVAGIMHTAVHLTDDMEADMRRVVDAYKDIQGKYPDQFIPDERYA